LARLLGESQEEVFRERFRQASRREREILRDVVQRRETELRQRYHLPLTTMRVELIIDQYLRWDCDLKSAFEELGRQYQQVRRFEAEFFAEHQLDLHFDEEAVDEILHQALKRQAKAQDICRERAKDLEYALKLVRDRTSQESFLLTREAINNLDEYLNQVIRDYYQKTLFRE
jgi:hypothetical protein